MKKTNANQGKYIYTMKKDKEIHCKKMTERKSDNERMLNL